MVPVTLTNVNRDVLSREERQDYIHAVKCLLRSPSKTDPVLGTGARVRFDDWAAQHINQTMSVHITVRLGLEYDHAW